MLQLLAPAVRHPFRNRVPAPPITAPMVDALGRTAVICGACRGSGLVPEGSITVVGDIARPGDRCRECEGSGISRWEWPSGR